MRTENASIAGALALLASASGARAITGIAAVTWARSRSETGPRILSRFDRQLAKAATAMAAFELMADKAPHIPDRVDAGPLLGRVLAGAAVGASVARLKGADRQSSAVAGALIAFASAHVSFRLRRELASHMPAFAAGLVEDALIIGIAAAGAALLEHELNQSPSAAA
jgi:uncharacterized membrane protein